ncbi:NADPH:quinone oxidoreductase family protein [Chelatococcus reniformis]|uniref:NADPH:quinone oxidoreductase n=1 Tax=Chelatococcus reniformis TaxID=1494448 RepID=A0A916XND5_9HYPH|nr:NADPH:quinone oxidoreductase family protein [Chelatococcus reniformis]GGC87044.1 NADPH:quinone oxidoreductase [Chelatococcus reniformis]
MQVLLSRAVGGPETLTLEEMPDPAPGPGEVLIEVAACGVNFPDLLLIQDLYQARPSRPFAPGAEVAGVVAAVGPNVEGFTPGDRVIGRTGWGGMAEKIVLDAGRCTRIPAAMPLDQAAVFLFTYATAYFALVTRGRLVAGETVLVLGAAGGVGIAAVQIAKALGARVVAAASSLDKLAFAREQGADDGLVYPEQAGIEEGRAFARSLKGAVGAAGADIIVDPVGGPVAEPALRAIAEGGRYLVLGFTAGIPAVPLNLPLLKSCDILGVNWRTFATAHAAGNEANQRELFRLYESGRIAPAITARYPLARGGEAIARLRDRSALGKVVVTMPGSPALLSPADG